MDPVFDAQFRIIKDAFANEGIRLEVAYTPAGTVDYVYRAGRLLTLFSTENNSRLNDVLRGFRLADPGREPREGELVELSIEDLERGDTSVPTALDLIDDSFGAEYRESRRRGVPPAYSPNHLVHIARLCNAVEPEVPSASPAQPWPPPCPPTTVTQDVLIGVVDTGKLQNLDPASYPWLDGVDGDPDPLGPPQPNGQPVIPAFTGHGTFISGVAKCMAPGAGVFVSRDFALSGAELEGGLMDKLEQLVLRSPAPQIINLSAGTYTRNDWTSLGFESFHQRHPDVTLVAAAGNDATDRPFYPAYYDWVIAVGALGPDQQHRAWFSNFGDWVDVYALGEGIVNAYATGEYTYQEPPKRPATQTFTGMARWDGTSFSAPLVAGLIANRMARTGESSVAAAAALAALAAQQAIPGVGPALFPCDEP